MTDPESQPSNVQFATITNTIESDDSRIQSPKKIQYRMLQKQLQEEIVKDVNSHLSISEMKKVQRKFDALSPFEIHEFIYETENQIMRRSFMNGLKKPSFLPRKAGMPGFQNNKSVSLDPRPESKSEMKRTAADFLPAALSPKKQKTIDVESKKFKLPRASENLKKIDYDYCSYKKNRKTFLNSIILEPEPKSFLDTLYRPASPKTEYNMKVLGDERLFVSSDSRNSNLRRGRAQTPWYMSKKQAGKPAVKDESPRKNVIQRIIEATEARQEEALKHKAKKSIPELVSFYFDKSSELPTFKDQSNQDSINKDAVITPKTKIKGILKNSPNGSLERKESPQEKSPGLKPSILPKRVARNDNVNLSLDMGRLERRKANESPKQIGSNLHKFKVPHLGFKAGVKENLRYNKSNEQETDKKVRFNQSMSIDDDKEPKQSEDIVKVEKLLNESLDFKAKVNIEKQQIQKKLQISDLVTDFQSKNYKFVSQLNDKTRQMMGLTYMIQKKDEMVEKMEINDCKNKYWDGMLAKNTREFVSERKKRADSLRLTHIKNKIFINS